MRPRFAADAMLGRLARWLRLLGYDTSFVRDVRDADLVAAAVREGRTILTRDRTLLERRLARGGILLASGAIGEQLAQLAHDCGVRAEPARLFTRCAACNGLPKPMPREQAAGRVPPYVLRTAAAFTACSGCGRVFWGGTHRARALERLAAWLPLT